MSNNHLPPDSFTTRYPQIAEWVLRFGWIELGHDHYNNSFARALDEGGMVWEGEHRYPTVEDALQALNDGIAAWRAEAGL
jgi:hypothetical protein